MATTSIDLHRQGRPGTLTNAEVAAGAGIAYSKLNLAGSVVNADIVSLAWSKLTGTPTTLAGYGIADPVVLTSGSYADPAWITSLAASKLTGTLGVTHGGTGTATTFTAGSLVFAGASGVYTQDATNLVWDNTTKHLGIASNGTPNVLNVGGLQTGNAAFEVSVGSGVVFQAYNRTLFTYATMQVDGSSINIRPGGTTAIGVQPGGLVALGTHSATAVLHIKAGTATANTAPLKLTSGTVLTAAEVGAIEFTTDDFFATITTGAARKAFVLDDGARLTSGKVPIAGTNGRLVDGPTPLAGTKVYYVSDTSGGAVTRKLTFTNGILTSET